MPTVKFTPYYLAGVLARAGLAMFVLFLIAQATDAIAFEGLLRPAVGGIGLLFLIIGGLMNIRLQARGKRDSA